MEYFVFFWCIVTTWAAGVSMGAENIPGSWIWSIMAFINITYMVVFHLLP